MAQPPKNIKIYHITHKDNLNNIIQDQCLWSDAQIVRRATNKMQIGMSAIKQRRLEELEVFCHTGTKVGEYVPFYFCPRSIMLYIIYSNNHPDLQYRGGQRPIVHLECDLGKVFKWATEKNVKWAFTTNNAGAYYVTFYNELTKLYEINWDAVYARDFRDPDIRESKQSEFLIFDHFPWELVESIGVYDETVKQAVDLSLCESVHKPTVLVKREWYY